MIDGYSVDSDLQYLLPLRNLTFFYTNLIIRFTPELLGATASRGLLLLVIEVLIVKFGFYLLNSSLPLLDIVAYCGYKYVGYVTYI
jgi:hypothetical protein